MSTQHIYIYMVVSNSTLRKTKNIHQGQHERRPVRRLGAGHVHAGWAMVLGPPLFQVGAPTKKALGVRISYPHFWDHLPHNQNIDRVWGSELVYTTFLGVLYQAFQFGMSLNPLCTQNVERAPGGRSASCCLCTLGCFIIDHTHTILIYIILTYIYMFTYL